MNTTKVIEKMSSFKLAQWKHENMTQPDDPPVFIDKRTGEVYTGIGGNQDEVVLKSGSGYTICVDRNDFDEHYEET